MDLVEKLRAKQYCRFSGQTIERRLYSFAPLLLLVSPLLLEQSNSVAASLVQIYHRYLPQQASVEPLNASSSTFRNALAQSNHRTQVESDERTVLEQISPMKRIMDLIGHHSPLIVVADSDEQPQQQPSSSIGNQQQQVAAAPSGLSMAPLEQQQQPQQHWTLLDTGQLVPVQQQHQVHSAAQQSHYYTFAQSQLPSAADQLVNQIALVPAEQNSQLGFAPTTNLFQQQQHQLVASSGAQLPFAAQLVPQVQVHPENVEQQQDNQVQPVFLSSYVPDANSQSGAANVGQHTANGNDQQQPNSIQQIQRQQQTGAQDEQPDEKSSSREESDSSGNGNEDMDIEDTSKPSNKEASQDEPSQRDDEESSRAARRTQGNGVDEPSENISGSMNYEDKSDGGSERQGERRKLNQRQKKSDQTSASRAEPSKASGGLIDVGLNDACLQCICRASSGCDQDLGCITLNSEEKYCGPFQLTEEYWQRAGSPGDAATNFQSFEDCANDLDCASETVTNYMKKYHTDCDNDGNITCLDYARLHRLMPNECENSHKLRKNHDSYWTKFENCADGYSRSRNGDSEDI